MGWALAQHRGFARELAKLDRADAEAVRASLDRLKAQLDRVGSVDPRKAFSSETLSPLPDLQSLRATGIPGSYRLRVGRHRVALAILPGERLRAVHGLGRRQRGEN